MRIHEFAKKINKDSKDIIAILQANEIEGKKPASSISESEMNMVLEKLQPEKEEEKKEKKKEEKKEEPKKNDNVKKENDYLFESSEPIKNPVAPTGTPAAGEVSKETFAKMGYMQRLELKRTDPEKYEQLKG